jgi:hypothetical protein
MRRLWTWPTQRNPPCVTFGHQDQWIRPSRQVIEVQSVEDLVVVMPWSGFAAC